MQTKKKEDKRNEIRHGKEQAFIDPFDQFCTNRPF